MSMRADSREYVKVQITANVLLDTQPVQIGLRKTKTAVTWYNATWVGAAATTRTARILVGPGGSPSIGVLTEGVWHVLWNLTDSPEIPAEESYAFYVSVDV